ncbi:MAG: SLC13 family permease, partial [Rhodothermales bacterium]
MTWEIAIVFGIVILALIVFTTERWPIDQVAVSVPVLLLVAGILTPAEAVSGLSNEGTVTVAGMLVISLGLVKTGAIARVARWSRSAKLGGPTLRLMVLCLIVAAISPFLNNTAVVAVFLPVFLAVARNDQRSPSKYLIPLSYAAILGGTITLIGTSSNLVIYGMAEARGLGDLSIFSIAPLGIIYMGAGLLYIFTIGRVLLPDRPGETDL